MKVFNVTDFHNALRGSYFVYVTVFALLSLCEKYVKLNFSIPHVVCLRTDFTRHNIA